MSNPEVYFHVETTNLAGREMLVYELPIDPHAGPEVLDRFNRVLTSSDSFGVLTHPYDESVILLTTEPLPAEALKELASHGGDEKDRSE